MIIDIKKEDLVSLLRSAYVAGNSGYAECDESVALQLIADFLEKNKIATKEDLKNKEDKQAYISSGYYSSYTTTGNATLIINDDTRSSMSSMYYRPINITPTVIDMSQGNENL